MPATSIPQVDVIGHRDTWYPTWPTYFEVPLSGETIPRNPRERSPPPGEPAPPPPAPPKAPEEPIPEVVVVTPRPQPPAAPTPPPPVLAAPIGVEWYGPQGATRIQPRPRPKPRPRPRRTKPATKPSRRTRPSTRPSGPRIRIPLPSLLRGLLGRLAGVASFVPLYLTGLAAVSDNASRQMYERLYGVPLDDDDRERSRDARPDSPRDSGAAERADFEGVFADPLAEILVTGTRPRPVATAEPVLWPIDAYGASPGLFESPVDAPAARPVPRRNPVNAPLYYPEPFAPGVPSPGIVPAPAPFPIASPAPAPKPYAPPVPRPELAPSPGLQPWTPPLNELQPQPQPQPSTASDPCNCGDKKDSKKKKKKPRDRAVCYRGTYVEKARGLSKRRRERIDCRTGKPLPPPAAANQEF